jgi:pimeloyl-ACP methyl ester carboxylesterase
MRISEAELAFTVHNPGDPAPATVRGTVFYTQKFDPGQHRAVLLLHGGTLDRRFWDGFNIPGALRFATELAYHSGTAVFTVDRLGYRVIEETSHDFPLHRSAEMTVKEMARWLKSF